VKEGGRGRGNEREVEV
jgi:hypothetical protein